MQKSKVTAQNATKNFHHTTIAGRLTTVSRGNNNNDSQLENDSTFNWRNNNYATKTLITQRSRTDLGRSVGVMKVSKLVLLNRFTESKTSH